MSFWYGQFSVQLKSLTGNLMLPLQIYIYGSCFYKNHVFRRPGLTNCRAIRLLLSQCLNCLPTFFDSFVIDHLYSQPSLLTFIQLVMKRGPAQLCFHIRLTAAAAEIILQPRHGGFYCAGSIDTQIFTSKNAADKCLFRTQRTHRALNAKQLARDSITCQLCSNIWRRNFDWRFNQTIETVVSVANWTVWLFLSVLGHWGTFRLVDSQITAVKALSLKED